MSVTMTVRPLPENVGAVLAVSPAALAFSATDGGADPDDQFLVVRNSGTQPLYWTIQDDKNVPQGTFITADYILDANWLNPEHTSGIVQPQSQSTIRVSVHSAALLPGTYTRTLLFAVQAKHQALNSPTPVNVSLTVQRSCGINVNSYVMRFTAIAQRSNPSPQSLSLTASDSCEETIPWSATSSERWLTLTPAAGKVSVAASSVLTVNVDITGLKPGDYTALILLVAGRSMYSIPIELKVQQPPTPTSPVLGAAPLSLNFGATMGQTGQAGQTVTLTNTGGGPMRWSTVVNELASTWLAASPSGVTINPGQTAQLTVNVSAGSLSSGTYAGQVEIHAFDTNDAEISGSPQIVSVSFVVRPPCTLSAPSSKSLSFTESDGGSAIAPQSISFSASGTCDWPLTWSASVQTANADWLKLTPVSGSLTNSAQPDALTFSVDRASLTSTSARRVSVQLSVVDKSGQAVQGGTQTIQIALVKPCGLVPSTNALSFTTTQGQGAGAQTISLDTVGSCKLPFAWSAGADDGNKNWLALSATSGTLDGDTGGLDVSVASTALAPGNYSATITLSGQDSSGAIVRAVTVMVSLTVNGFTLSGTVNACPDTSCASPPALANATVTLKDAGGATIRTTMADAQGHYTFTNVAAGTYSLSASGGNYAGSTGQITVSGDTTMNINTTAPTSSPTP